MMEPTRADYLKKIQAANLPLLIVQGDADVVVTPDHAKNWAATAEDLGMKDFKFVLQPGIDHGPVITSSQEEIFNFFNSHSKK
jgi:alpha-beta hydrolase superfamily lysophospholipase